MTRTQRIDDMVIAAIRSSEWLVPHLPARLDRATLRPATWPNVALAALLIVTTSLDVLLTKTTLEPLSLALLAVALVPLVALAWRPRIAVALFWMSGATWLICSAAHVSGGGDTATLIAIYTIGTQRSWRQTAVVCGIALVAAAFAGLVSGHGPFSLEAVLTWIAYIAIFAIMAATGLWVGQRRAIIAGLMDRTLHLQWERDRLEAERDLLARQAVAVERARIARELHDVVAHHVSVMVIQAGAAEASLPPNAAASAQAIEAVRETGREALAEMRRLLGLLRSESSLDGDGDGDGAGGTAEMAPQPSMTELAALADRTREAGVSVTTEIVGSARRLPPGVDLSVYRVVQEALTNTLRHAGPGAHATLRLTYAPDAVTVEVTDDGKGRPSASAVERGRSGVGHGLLGMRERVSLFGGRLQAGPTPNGGFRIEACFPLETRPAEPTTGAAK